MKLSERKIDHIRSSLFEKLEINSRIGLAMFAVSNGLSQADALTNNLLI
jgi:DNA-binding NarL/FixJ family response regulator